MCIAALFISIKTSFINFGKILDKNQQNAKFKDKFENSHFFLPKCSLIRQQKLIFKITHFMTKSLMVLPVVFIFSKSHGSWYRQSA